jgi:RNA polymerase sigma-70 factor (ECF subfamily)
MHTAQENRLISEILNGDVEAFAVLVNRYQRPIYNLMLRMTGSREDATDLTQEAFLKAYQKLERFRPSSRFFPWLYTIGMNLARDHLRRLKTADTAQWEREEVMAAHDPIDRAQELIHRLDADRILVLLAKLPEGYREALILRFHEGLTLDEVGVALGISTSGAKMRIKRGLQRLRDMLHRNQKRSAAAVVPIGGSAHARTRK